MELNNHLQKSQEQKQKQGCLTTKSYNKIHHHYFDSMDFRHISPLIPIDSSHLRNCNEQ